MPIAIVGFIAYSQLQQNTLDNRFQEMGLVLSQVENSFNQQLTSINANIALFSSNYLVHKYALTTDEAQRFGLLQRPLLNLFRGYQQSYPDYYEIRFILPDGYESARLTSQPLQNATEEELDDPLVQALLSQDRQVKTSIHINPDNQELALFAGMPLYLRDLSVEPLSAPEVLRGALLITYNLQSLKSLVAATRFGEAGKLLVISRDGDIQFADNSPDLIYSFGNKLSPGQVSSVLAANQQPMLISVSGDYYVRSSEFFPGYYMVALLPTAELAQITQSLAINVIAVTIVSILVFSTLVFFLVRRLVISPIEELDRVSTLVSQGKLDVQVEAFGNDEIAHLARTFNGMTDNLHRANEQVKQFNKELEQRVQERTSELKSVNHELESFAYSVSHDLRAPLRAIDGFSHALVEDYHDKFDPQGQEYLDRVRGGAQRMGKLIDDLLQLSRINRDEIAQEEVDLGSIAQEVIEELKAGEPDRKVEFEFGNDLKVSGDPRLLRVLMDNLLGNAWKFTGREPVASIILGRDSQDPDILFVRDNGVGFNMDHEKKLFGAFERLHHINDFPGSGVGLASVMRIINRHGGSIWAEAKEGEGATFFFTLVPGEKREDL
ncbi:MAG: ATP-binding protein [Gammaproteobacteria bacterium]|nr:ATP-binding protein [Gammaproteobacteria bacterium]